MSIFFMLISCSDIKQINSQYISPQCIAGQSSCSIITTFGLLKIKFNVESVVPEQPFIIVAELMNSKQHSKENSKENKYKITGYLEGKNMYMGKIPLFFSVFKAQKKTSDEEFRADVLLGSCSEHKMVWRMWLIISDDKGNNETVFVDFTSSRS